MTAQKIPQDGYANELESYPRIGLIADTHEMRSPTSFGPAMAALNADLNIHLGDVGSSPTIVGLVDTFKKMHGEVEMTGPQRAKFDDSIARGRSPVRAYLESWIAIWPELDQIRVKETFEHCSQVLGAWQTLPRPCIVAGNVDRNWLQHPAARKLFEDSGAELVELPRLLDYGQAKLLLWPSMSPKSRCEREEMEQSIARIGYEINGCDLLAVFAHEQLFRGPTPARYISNLKDAGLSPSTIPYYAPNPTRRELGGLLAALSPECQILAFSGHIHDRQEVIAAGVKYLPEGPNGGLLLRLPPTIDRIRRHVECFCLPAGVPAKLELRPDRAILNLVGPVGSMAESTSGNAKN